MIGDLQPFAVSGRLLGDDIGIVAVRGRRRRPHVGGGHRRAAGRRHRDRHPLARGPAGRSPTTTTCKALQDALGTTTKNKAALRAEGCEQLAQRLAAPDVERRGRGRPLAVLRAGRVPRLRRGRRLDHRRVPGPGRRGRARGRATRARSPPDLVVVPAATALHGGRLPLVVAGVWADVTDGPDRADAVQPIRDSELASHGLDRRRPRPGRGPDHRRAGDVRPLPHAAGRRATTATDPTRATPPGPGQRVIRARAGGRGAAGALAAATRRASSSCSRALGARAGGRGARARPRPRTGRGADHLAARHRVGRLRAGVARPTSTRLFEQPAVGGMVTNGVDRPTPLPSGYVTARRRRAGGRQRCDRRPGLRRRRGLRARPGRRGVHHPHRHPGAATGSCTCRSPTPSRPTTRSSTAPSPGLLGDELAGAGIARAVIANGDGTDPSTPETRVVAVATRRGRRRS